MTDQQIAAYNNNLHAMDWLFWGFIGFCVGVMFLGAITQLALYWQKEKRTNTIGQYQVVHMPSGNTPCYIVWNYVLEERIPLGPFRDKQDARTAMHNWFENDRKHYYDKTYRTQV